MCRQRCEEICNFWKREVGGERKKNYMKLNREGESVIRQWCFLRLVTLFKAFIIVKRQYPWINFPPETGQLIILVCCYVFMSAEIMAFMNTWLKRMWLFQDSLESAFCEGLSRYWLLKDLA